GCSRPPANASSAAPRPGDPAAGGVWLDGRLPAPVVRAPLGPILEMREVKPPLYGPTGAGTWRQSADVVIWLPPRPPSATYRSPSGPNASPRGLFKPVANTVTFAGNGEAPAGEAAAGAAARGPAAASHAPQPARRAVRHSFVKDQGRECIAIASFFPDRLGRAWPAGR